jgi:2-oxoglutarate dehydrogenase E2 component (dihydrolipoamide succinyltransferase)
MPTKVIMPQLGESVVEGTVAGWYKQVGDAVEEFEPLLEVESDKVNSEIPSPAGGTLLAIYVPEGQTVTAGTLLAYIGQPGEEVPAALAVQAAAHTAPSGHADLTPAPMSEPAPVYELDAAAGEVRFGDGGQGGRPPTGGPRISPVVANIAAQHSIDVGRVPGTGRDGRVTKKDILAYVERLQRGEAAPVKPAEEELPPWERPGSGDLFKPTDDLYQKAAAPVPAAPPDHVHAAPPAPGAPGELVELSKMRRRIAEHMVMSKLHTAPHVTTVFEADMSAVAAHRDAHKAEFAKRGANLTYTAYFVAALARALRLHPLVNSRWTDEGIYLYPDVNIGMAAAIDDGLIVPVIRRADELSLVGLSRQINDLASRARAGQLVPDEVQGGTFTITNHGVSGSLFATPIINQPQTAIFGVGALQKRVVVTAGDAIAIRPMIYLTLTFDHRVLDGASADWFMADVKKILETWA